MHIPLSLAFRLASYVARRRRRRRAASRRVVCFCGNEIADGDMLP